ncbi:alanine--tRNA ligase-related protein [endosymbiont GvMRE of Glomus versiforme]|uniref:alanine--tRNA ligase-related protein n=1 Tax=endosymbiont GvMRE of Glomus versiforme TaxID=2039283 RepID=UPI000EC761AC|nr:alanine--tRNA ligase-related protein [endosymbiont GvMRE of Glomus versiforme]RHZ35220.1 Alanine--tRNA ligase [endosymbiont GvMRE of Glomus versiforme]
MTNTNEQKGNYFIIADHLRTTIFALADGATFESKGRGYVLKKLVKKVTLLAYVLNISNDRLEKISKKLIEINSFYHTHLKNKEEIIISEIKKEIDKSNMLISKSVKKLANYHSPIISAENIFFWYDTEGVPLELIRTYLEDRGQKFPEFEFKELLEKQKKRSLKDRKKKKTLIF